MIRLEKDLKKAEKAVAKEEKILEEAKGIHTDTPLAEKIDHVH